MPSNNAIDARYQKMIRYVPGSPHVQPMEAFRNDIFLEIHPAVAMAKITIYEAMKEMLDSEKGRTIYRSKELTPSGMLECKFSLN